jgi:FkbM family methyltransferase
MNEMMKKSWILQSISSVLAKLPVRGKERVTRPILSRVRGDYEVRVGGVRMLLSPRDYIQRCVMLGCLEREDTEKSRRLLRPGDAVIDVGANCGGLSAIYAQCVGRDGLVLGFEPNPRLKARLDFMKENNDLPQLRVLPLALGSEDAEVRLSLPPPDSGNEDATLAVVSGWETATVKIRKLDDELATFSGRRFRLMKIDIEGHEHQALKGGSRALSEGVVENLLVEFNPYWLKEQGSSSDELWDYIVSLGFQACQPKPILAVDELANAWFVHRSAHG